MVFLSPLISCLEVKAFSNFQKIFKENNQKESMDAKTPHTTVYFSNYNYAFIYFNRKYVELCISLSKTMSIRDVRRKVSAFIYEFSYSVPDDTLSDSFKKELDIINQAVNEDVEFGKVLEKEELTFRERVGAYPNYYKHFIKYLDLLSRFISELSSTYMPRTNLQSNLLKFKNDSPFYESIHEFKKEVFDSLSNFSVETFNTNTNLFITYFFAYKLFVNEIFVHKINNVLSLVLSIFVNKDTIDLLIKYPDYNLTDIKKINEIETTLQKSILFCNSLVNKSLSIYGVLPKVMTKVYADRTLI